MAHKEKRHAEDSGHFLQFMCHYKHKKTKVMYNLPAGEEAYVGQNLCRKKKTSSAK